MTRDEAIVKVRKAMERGENTSCVIVDSLVALGMLKLDEAKATLTYNQFEGRGQAERAAAYPGIAASAAPQSEPKSAYKRAYDLLDSDGYQAAQILEFLTAHSLKIVEK